MESNKDDARDFSFKDFIEENVEDLYENAPCGYLSTLPDGTIVKINGTLLQWLKYQREEVVFEKKIQDLLTIGGKIFYETHYAPLLQMQGFINEINYSLVCKNKTTIPVLVNTVAFKDTSDKVQLFRTTVFNITDRKK